MANLLNKIAKIFKNKQLSAVAAITNKDGDIDRVIVGPLEDMSWHIVESKFEKLIIIPEKWVEEPIPWDQQSSLIDYVHRYVGALRFTKELENK